jgi:hypothetical protein
MYEPDTLPLDNKDIYSNSASIFPALDSETPSLINYPEKSDLLTCKYFTHNDDSERKDERQWFQDESSYEEPFPAMETEVETYHPVDEWDMFFDNASQALPDRTNNTETGDPVPGESLSTCNLVIDQF